MYFLRVLHILIAVIFIKCLLLSNVTEVLWPRMHSNNVLKLVYLVKC